MRSPNSSRTIRALRGDVGATATGGTRRRAILRRHHNPCSVATLVITSLLVVTVAAWTRLALRSNGSARGPTYDRADCGPAPADAAERRRIARLGHSLRPEEAVTRDGRQENTPRASALLLSGRPIGTRTQKIIGSLWFFGGSLGTDLGLKASQPRRRKVKATGRAPIDNRSFSFLSSQCTRRLTLPCKLQDLGGPCAISGKRPLPPKLAS
jgi:hypothetical protein